MNTATSAKRRASVKPSSPTKEPDIWDEVLGMWRDKKIDGLKFQKKIRQEWK